MGLDAGNRGGGTDRAGTIYNNNRINELHQMVARDAAMKAAQGNMPETTILSILKDMIDGPSHNGAQGFNDAFGPNPAGLGPAGNFNPGPRRSLGDSPGRDQPKRPGNRQDKIDRQLDRFEPRRGKGPREKKQDFPGNEPNDFAGRAKTPKFRGGGGGGGGNDIMGYLDDYLAEKMSAQGATFDYEKALRDSEQAIRRAYRNDIDAIQGQNKRARKDTAANRREVEQLYNVLANSFQKEQGEALAQGEQLAGMMQEISQGAAGNVQDLVSKMAAEQASLAQGLGIEAALPSMGEEQLPQATADVTSILGEGAEDANRMLGFAGNQMQWLQSGETGSRMEGANRSAELLKDLQDFIQGNRDKISGLRGQRGREIAGNKDDIMAAVAEMQAAADEQLWDQLSSYADLKLDVEDTQFDNDLALKKFRSGVKQDNIENRQWAKEFGLDKALAMQPGGSDANSGLPGFMEDALVHIQQMNPKAQGVIGDVLSSERFAEGRTEGANGEIINMNPTMAANLAEQEARKRGVTNPSQLNLIRLAAMAYASGGI